MCQIRAPAGINLTPSQHKEENMPIAMLQASAVENRSSLGFSFGLASVFTSLVFRVVKSRPVATRSSISSSKGDPKCGLELMTLAL